MVLSFCALVPSSFDENFLRAKMTDLVENSKAMAAGILSIFILITAVVDLICGAIYASIGGVQGSGLWTGFGLLLCAVLGLITWLRKSKTAMMFFLVLDILWFVACAVGAVISFGLYALLSIIRATLEDECSISAEGSCHCSGENDIPMNLDTCDDIIVAQRCMFGIFILDGVGALLALGGSIIGCIGVCCTGQVATTVVVVEPSGGAMQRINQGAPEYPSFPGNKQF